MPRRAKPIAFLASLLFLGVACHKPAPKRAAPSASGSASAQARSTASAPAPAPAARLLARMQGRWRIKAPADPDFKSVWFPTLRIQGDQMMLRQHAGVDQNDKPVTFDTHKKIRIDESTHPAHIDLTHASPSKGWNRTGIISLQGDRLRMCLTYPQGPRPTSMRCDGRDQELWDLERVR